MPTARSLFAHVASLRTTLIVCAAAFMAMVAPPALARADEPLAIGSVVEAAQAAAAATDAAPAIVQAPPGVDLPERARDGIAVDTAAGSIALGLPATGRADEVGGASVFDGAGSENMVVVEALSDGARAMVQITGPHAPAEYRFPIAGAQRLELSADGSVDVYDTAQSDLNAPVATIAPAWAKDANGNDVQTRYEIAGTTLVQHVRFNADTAFPVTADPTFSGSCGWVTCTVRLSRAATRNARDAGWLIAAAGGACAAVTAGAGAFVCAAAIAPAAVSLAVFAGRYYEVGHCLAIHFTHPPILSVAWPSSVKHGDHNCK